MFNKGVLYLHNIKTGEQEIINTSDILKIDTDSKYGAIFITQNGQSYRFVNTAEFWSELLHQDGFRLLDRSNAVNMNQVCGVDDERMEVKFYDSNITASVTQMHKEYTKYILKHKVTGRTLYEIDVDFMVEQNGKSIFKKLISHLGKMVGRSTDREAVGEKV